MKSFLEICKMIKRIADNPEEKVDYLKVRDYLQMRLHIDVCEPCNKLMVETLQKAPKEEPSVNFGGASEN